MPDSQPAERWSHDPGWRLFRDWCLATGRTPLPADRTTIAEFLRRFPAAPATLTRRRQAISRAHRRCGHPDPIRQEPSAPEPDPRLPAFLRDAVVRGWPAAVSGRRDAFLAVLRWHTGMSRPELAVLDGDGVRRALALTVPGEEPGECPRCGLTRWLRLLAVAQRHGWGQVRRQLAGQFPGVAATEALHDCTRPLRETWPRMPLLPAIDRHGNVEATGPISGRAITATARRINLAEADHRTPSAAPRPPTDPPCPVPWDRAASVRDMHWLDDRLDDLDRRIADLDRAITTLAYDGPKVG
ncbi:hypothetical protein Namu_2751 [Nakamurella multipartita DSM 44233]|uniref:Core-binding (CB) domain-containing protein n=2 Tax=Nakamurella TaxID=53460 RepID=C8X8P2_NAKMY|nr:hypothetical protein Namu_2751 [Nakamurella multipartita DSM 44233]